MIWRCNYWRTTTKYHWLKYKVIVVNVFTVTWEIVVLMLLFGTVNPVYISHWLNKMFFNLRRVCYYKAHFTVVKAVHEKCCPEFSLIKNLWYKSVACKVVFFFNLRRLCYYHESHCSISFHCTWDCVVLRLVLFSRSLIQSCLSIQFIDGLKCPWIRTGYNVYIQVPNYIKKGG